jgi:predicted negative regulator of RcsB-dependent stress response
VEQYRTEDEQVEALKRWWDENGRSTIAAIIIALSAGFAWQTWKGWDERKREGASDAYQAMLQVAAGTSADQRREAVELAEALKENYGGSTYAQFAALHLARLAVEAGDLAEAQAQLRWVLGKADKGSDIAQVAQVRLARVLASSGEAGQALTILEQAGEGPYSASYALARGDILLQLGRDAEALQAYTEARMHAAAQPGQVNLATLEQKLQSLTPVASEPPAGAAGEEQ